MPVRLSRMVLPLLSESISSLKLMVALAVMSRGVHLLPLSSADGAEGCSSSIVDAGVEEGDRDDAVVGTSVFIVGVIPWNGMDIPEYGKLMPGNGRDMPRYGKDMPGYDKDMPGYGKDMPGYGKDIPGYGKDMPGYGKDMPDSFPKEASCRKRMWANLTS